jgi:predicted alpha/beta-fold hydrolase
VLLLYRIFDYLDDYLQRFSQLSRDDLGLFRFGNTWQENDHIVELSATQNTRPRQSADSFSIIAVHGLGGDWEKTWVDDNGALWLRDFLPSQLPPARIMSYGYNSRTAFSKAVTDISDEAAMLLDRLDGERQSKDQKARPIIFVSHSLGGIIVKKVRVLSIMAIQC